MKYVYSYRVRRFKSMDDPAAGMTRRCNFTTQLDKRVEPGYTFMSTVSGKYGRYCVDSLHAVYADDGFCLVCFPCLRSKSEWEHYLTVCQTYEAFDLVAELMQIGYERGYIPSGSSVQQDYLL